ncbi:Ribonuclease H-like domain [Phytophthora cactorum]|nr:Ribonuclease H-like domain [Phytophthora cactorum]
MYSIPPRSLAADLFVPNEGDYSMLFAPKASLCTGYTNLVEHLTRCHTTTYDDEFRSIQRREGSLDAFVKVVISCENLQLVGWIIMENVFEHLREGEDAQTVLTCGHHRYHGAGKDLAALRALENDAVISSDAIIDLLYDVLDMYGTELLMVKLNTITNRHHLPKLLGSTESYEVVEDADGSPTKRYSAEAALSEGAPAASVANMKWVPPTSNDVERLFSRAGIVYSRLRRSLNPMTLETILFLQYNRVSSIVRFDL